VKFAFTTMNLADVRMIMAIMHVLVDKLLCQAVMRRIPVVECLLSGVRGCLWLRPIMPGIKWCCCSSGASPVLEIPRRG
jgi:hypothetical protein